MTRMPSGADYPKLSVMLVLSVLASSLFAPMVSARNWVDLQTHRADDDQPAEEPAESSESPVPAGPSTGVVPQVSQVSTRCPQRPTLCPASRLLTTLTLLSLMPLARLEPSHTVYVIDLVPVAPRCVAPSCWPHAPPVA